MVVFFRGRDARARTGGFACAHDVFRGCVSAHVCKYAPAPVLGGGGDWVTQVGAGRVAQLLTQGVLGSRQLWLSSGVAPAESSAAGDANSNNNGGGDNAATVLEIFPPFRLELAAAAGAPKQTIVEAGSDAEFRAVNPLRSQRRLRSMKTGFAFWPKRTRMRPAPYCQLASFFLLRILVCTVHGSEGQRAVRGRTSRAQKPVRS